jgi:hypothetical protein
MIDPSTRYTSIPTCIEAAGSQSVAFDGLYQLSDKLPCIFGKKISVMVESSGGLDIKHVGFRFFANGMQYDYQIPSSAVTNDTVHLEYNGPMADYVYLEIESHNATSGDVRWWIGIVS